MLIGMLICQSALLAQSTIEGQVVDNTDEALIGASVIVRGTSVGTVTDIDGNYSLRLPEGADEIEISYTGYETITLNVNEDDVKRIVLSEGTNALNEVIVTGLATSIKRANSANAVASISAKELVGVTPQNTIDGALYGKFKGAEIRANSGAPGGGFSVRLRGVTSVFLNQQPQYIIDGVYIDNSTISLGTDIVTAAAGGGNTATNQDDASNRVADLIPEDIESIEILKGASAAAIYGLGGAGGVVVINTKSGRFNQPARVNFSQTVGVSAPTRLLGDRGWDRAKVLDVFGEDEAARFDVNGTSDYESILYDNRPLQSISALSVSGGSQNTTYYVSGTYRNQGGLVDNTGYEKASLRANITNKLTDRLQLKVNTQYIYSQADRGLFNNSNANTTVGYGMAFTRPWDALQPDKNGNYPANGRVGSNVLETVALTTNEERINRFFGSVNLTYDIIQQDNQTLKAGIDLGLDQYNLRSRGLFPQSLSFYRDPSSLRGVSIAGNGFNNRTNMTAFLVHSIYTDSDINFRSQIGAIQLDQNQNVITTIASGLNGSQENVDQAENISVGQTRQIEQIKGAFFQEEINWSDKIIATVGIRADKSSNNGDPNEIFWNPKASLAVNIHEFVDMDGSGLSQLKPRIAYGQSARFAGFGDRFNALNPAQIAGSAGLFTSGLRGNPDVRPETQVELEFGADLGFVNNRVLLTATYYIKTIEDLLLRAQVPASTGFTNQVVNAGELENRGIELGLETELVKTNDLSWAMGLNWWKNNSEVTRLDIPAFNTGGFAAFLGQGRIEEGQPATQLVGTIDPSRCNSENDCSNVDPEGDGFMVFGDMEADFNFSWTNSLLWKGFELNWLLHWKEGGDGINLSTLLYDLGAVTWDFDDTTLDPTGATTNGNFRLGALGTHPGVYIEDASYMRLREIGLYYSVPRLEGALSGLRVGVSARNLINIFDYNSYDPEVSNFGNNVLINSVEVTPYPANKTYNFHVSATF